MTGIDLRDPFTWRGLANVCGTNKSLESMRERRRCWGHHVCSWDQFLFEVAVRKIYALAGTPSIVFGFNTLRSSA